MKLVAMPSPNQDGRGGVPVSMLILHYTGMASAQAALSRLCDPAAKVSAHYTVGEDGTLYAHVPEDRHRYGMTSGFTASETAIMGYHRNTPFSIRGLLDYRAATRHCSALMDRYDVRPRRPGQIAVRFSGGNQQKLVMARETVVEPRVLLVGQPTRGVDIGAIEFIHRQLVALRDAGCAVLVVSVELDEVMSLADRILVMYGGRIVGEVPGPQADERTLGLMMANLWNQAGAA